MYTEYLPVFRDNAVLTIAEGIPLLDEGAVSWHVLLALCATYRIKGIASFLLEGDPQPLLVDLHKSGRMFAYGLTRIPEEQKITSKSRPFFDAVASNDWEGARAIARQTRSGWNEGVEYEDDFLYVWLLMVHFFLEGDAETTEALLHRYAELVTGRYDARHRLAQALLHRDQEIFDEAMDHFLLEYEAHYKMLSDTGMVAQDVEATEGNISSEGLALVRLAHRVGLTTQANYLYIPSLAQIDIPVVFVDQAWRYPQE